MENVSIQRIRDNDQARPLLQQTLDVMDDIRRRAYELFQQRGAVLGSDVSDWLQAEREVLQIPNAELSENDGEFQIQLALPGFASSDIRVAALPDSLIVEAENKHQHRATQGGVHFCEFNEHRVFRRIPVPKPVDVDRVTARLERGLLEIHAPKAEETEHRGRKAAA